MKPKILFIILFIGMTFTLGKAGVESAKYAHVDEKKTKALKEAERANIDFSDVYKNAKGKIKKKEFKNGDYYVGEWSKGKPHGYGKIIYANKSSYTGNWYQGNIHGDGILKLPDGSQYAGYWVDNKYHGKGKVTYPNGDWYDGQWTMGKNDGIGKVYIRSLDVNFEGISNCELQKDRIKFNPISGKYSTPKKTMEGRWDSSPDGYVIFNGTYQNDSLKFNGTMKGDTFANGELVYNGKTNGSCSLILKNEKIFNGTSDCIIDKTYLCDSPAKYIGEWKQGKFIGKFEGKNYGPNTIRYNLSSDDSGLIFGMVQRTDGGVYFGLFKDKKLNGNGKLFYPEIEYKGFWEDGQWTDGTATVKNTNNDTVYLTRKGNELIVDDPGNNLSGSYMISSLDYYNPLKQIKLYADEQQKLKIKKEQIQFFDTNYAGLVFKSNISGSDYYNSSLGYNRDLVLTLCPGGSVILGVSTQNLSLGAIGEFWSSVISGEGEPLKLVFTKDTNVFEIEDSNEKLRISNDRKTATLYFSNGKHIEFHGLIDVGPVKSSSKLPTTVMPGTYSGSVKITHNNVSVKGDMYLVISQNNKCKLYVNLDNYGLKKNIDTSGFYTITDGKITVFDNDQEQILECAIVLNGKGLFLIPGELDYKGILMRQ